MKEGGSKGDGETLKSPSPLSPEPELESEGAPDLPVAQIPEPPAPDMPVWNIDGFALLEGRLVMLGEEEVRKSRGGQGTGQTWC